MQPVWEWISRLPGPVAVLYEAGRLGSAWPASCAPPVSGARSRLPRSCNALPGTGSRPTIRYKKSDVLAWLDRQYGVAG